MRRIQRSVSHLLRALAQLAGRRRGVPRPSEPAGTTPSRWREPARTTPSRWREPAGVDDQTRNAALRRELETRARALGIKRARNMSTAELAREIAKRF